MKLLNAFEAYWRNMSQREQRLALAVAALAVLFTGYTTVQRSIERIQQLDRNIDTLHDAILNAAAQIAVRESVEAQYREVAAQHSSAWTEAEIHSRLQEEILRLNQVEPPPLDEATGAPVTMDTGSGALVELPAIGQGTLLEGGRGYRQYSINIRIPRAEFSNLIAFLERLHMSPQSLRIDGLDITRPYNQSIVNANVSITRIIVDGRPDEGAAVRQARETEAERIGRGLDEWIAAGCTLTQGTEELGPEAIVAAADGPGARLHLRTRVASAETFDLQFDALLEGEAAITVYDEDRGRAFSQEIPLRNDGQAHRYRVRFTAPGNPGFPATVGAPYIQFKGGAGRILLDNVTLSKAARS